MIDDITYCASDCETINCIRNKVNIKDNSVLHSWCSPEGIPDCPLKKLRQLYGEPKDCSGHVEWRG